MPYKHPLPSSLTLNIVLQESLLSTLLNKHLSTYTSQENHDGTGWQITIHRTEDIEIRINDGALFIFAPFRFEMESTSSLLAQPLRIRGSVRLKWRTVLNISPSWTIESKSQALNVAWVEKPKFEIAHVGVPLSSISNFIFRWFGDKLLAKLDRQLNTISALKEWLQPHWINIQEGIPLPLEHQSKICIYPQEVILSNPLYEDHTLCTQIEVPIRIIAYLGMKTDSPAARHELPTIQKKMLTLPEVSIVPIHVHISYDFLARELEKILDSKLPKYLKSKASICVKRIILSHDDQLELCLELSGKITGKLTFKSTIDLDSDAQSLALDLHLSYAHVVAYRLPIPTCIIRSFLAKIFKELRTVPVNPILTTLQTQLENQLDEQNLSPLELNYSINYLQFEQLKRNKRFLEAIIQLDAKFDLTQIPNA